MNSFSGFAASYLANTVWQVALVAGAGWLAARLLKRLGPQVEHCAWVSTLVIAVATPALPVLRALLASLIAPLEPGQHASAMITAAQSVVPNPGATFAFPQAVLWSVLVFYVAVTVYFAVRLVRSLLGAAALLRRAVPVVLRPEQDEIWRRCQGSFSLHKARILASSQVSSPAALGLWAPVLLLPADFAALCAPQDFLAALAHECAHLKRRDFQKNLFYEAATLALAFHPLIWLVKSQIAQTREMVCDAMATERVAESRSYAHSLLRLATMVALASPPSTLHAIGIFDADILEKRIMKINTKKPHTGAIVRYGLIVPAMLFLLFAAIGSAAMAVVIQPQSPAQKAKSAAPYGHVYKIGKGVSAPVPIFTPKAQYSYEAWRAKYQGVCIIGLIVDAHGNPEDVHVVRALGMGLDQNAMEAVRKYKFKPAMLNGKTPVSVYVNVEVNYKQIQRPRK